MLSCIVSLPLPTPAPLWSSSMLMLMGCHPCFLEVQCPGTLPDPVSPAPNRIISHPTLCPLASRFTLPGHSRSSCRGPLPKAPLQIGGFSHLLPDSGVSGPPPREPPLRLWGCESLLMGPCSVPTPVPLAHRTRRPPGAAEAPPAHSGTIPHPPV